MRIWTSLERLLHRRREIDAQIALGQGLGALWRDFAILIVAGASAYGAVLGMWRWPILALYVAIKLPLLLLLTSWFVLLLNWISSRILGAELSFLQVGVLSYLAMAVASLILLALVPVTLLFTYCAPEQSLDARVTHNSLLLMHVGAIGLAGLAGTRFLWKALSGLPAAGPRVRSIYAVWLLSFVLVGCQLSWILRPWVGSVYYDPVFIRAEALDGNFYEFLFADVIPRLLTGRKLYEP
ncbi:MAG: hypothetical protein HY720_00130 [Planctomycetes bacterium]|nr:hypothetical protein [Planctomycetota bacterium]